MGQVSFARLHRPEATHPDDVDRTTASVHYVVPRASGPIATSVIWATNHKSEEETRTHAVTLETAVPLTPLDTVSARVEWSQRDELFAYDHDLAHAIEEQTGKSAFDVSALTLSYTREIATFRRAGLGLGGSVTRYWADEALAPYYGGSPWGASVWLRVRLEPRSQVRARAGIKSVILAAEASRRAALLVAYIRPVCGFSRLAGRAPRRPQ